VWFVRYRRPTNRRGGATTGAPAIGPGEGARRTDAATVS
jgi:hypothetical protein